MRRAVSGCDAANERRLNLLPPIESGSSLHASRPRGLWSLHQTIQMPISDRLSQRKEGLSHQWVRRVVLLPLVAALSLGLSELPQVESDKLTKEQRVAVVERIGGMLEERYVFPDAATECARALRAQLADGVFSDIADPVDFASELTVVLRSVSHDKHMLVRVRLKPEEGDRARVGQGLRDRARRRQRDEERNFGFEKLERFDGNIGYLDLRYFSAPRAGQDSAVAAMAFLEHSDAVIFDLRKNEGGSPGMVNFLCSHLFAEQTHLNSLYFREGDRTEEYWTLPGVPGRAMPDVPVFVLTSAATFSAAEEFSYNLLTQERAQIVGEVTRGGANPGGVFPVDEQFEMVIPTGRAINPVTGTNWEGVGVQPDLIVPADRALEAALALAGPAAETHRARKRAPWEALEIGLEAAVQADTKGRPADAALGLINALRKAQAAGLLDEGAVNVLGGELLDDGRSAMAMTALSFNVDNFPKSPRALVSLGLAQSVGERVGEAIESFEQALVLDPEGPGADRARARIAELKAREDSKAPR